MNHKLLPLLLALTLILAGCQLPGQPAPTPETFPPTDTPVTGVLPSPTMFIFPSATPLPTATLIPTLPPATPLPTATLIPTLPPTATATSASLLTGPLVTPNTEKSVFKVNFPAGRTGVQISGTVPGNMLHRYLVRALQDQTLIAEIFSVRNDVTLALYTEAGRLIHPEDSGISVYQWRLPANQEYRLEVIGPAADSDYRLVINIPRVVRFAVGTFGQSQTGAVSQGEVFLYRLRARQGQTMTLNLTPTNGAVALGVYGMESGDELLRPELGETSWSGVLPADTHYLVQVVGLGAGETNFGISFDIR